MEMGDGSIGAFPNNRVLWIEPAIWKEPFQERPDFLALDLDRMAEGLRGRRLLRRIEIPKPRRVVRTGK